MKPLPKSQFYKTRYGRIHFLDEGEGPAVILLHGNPTWSYYYRNLILVLKKTHRVLALDYLGCGLSDSPKMPLHWADHVAIVSEWLSSLSLPSFDFVLHDWGGGIGMGVIKNYFERVGKIALLNTGVFFAEPLPLSIRMARLPYVGYFLTVVCDLFLQGALKCCTVKSMNAETVINYQMPYRTWRRRQVIYDFVRDIPVDEDHPSYSVLKDLEAFLPQLHSKPMKAFWGMQDFVFNASYLNHWQSLLPHLLVKRYGNAGHWVLEDAQGEIEKDIHDFLQGILR
jgi:haloalkane dehalogenase